MLTMSFISLMLSFTFMFLSHPLSLGFILLAQTILISISTGMLNYNFWFSYMLFLIMVGGMLILFLYMTSIASNEKFKFSYMITLTTILMTSMIIAMLITDKFLINLNLSTYDIINQNLKPNNSKSLIKFFNQPSKMNLMMIIIYLFITLIMVVKIINIQYGPLRQKF